MRHALAIALTSSLLLLACGDDLVGSDVPGPKPTAPLTDDPSYTVSKLRTWYIIGDGTTVGHPSMYLDVVAPPGTDHVDAWIAGLPARRLVLQDGHFLDNVDITGVPAGDFDVLLSADDRGTAFAHRTFHHSHPYYLMMATDWDFSDPSDQALHYIDELRMNHPSLVMTHFVGPYLYTDPLVTAQRQADVTTWITTARDVHGDEIGLHIHPWCNFVEYAGLTCITDQSTVYASDTSGYTVELSAYGEAGLETLLGAADTLFDAHGLGKPTAFRAGGWTADADSLRALAAHGYVADSSALNWERMEEWIGVGTGVLYEWNMQHWAPIGDTSQPYYPNQDDPISTAAPTLDLLEVPDNGIMVDYVSDLEMEQIFNENWNGSALEQPHTLMIGFHPSSTFPPSEYTRLDKTLIYTEQYMAADDHGPVIYATLGQMPAVFPEP